MATYQIEWKPSALRELKRLDRQIVSRIVTAIDSLSANPFPPGIKKLHGGDRSYRMRVGDYRVIYEIASSRLVIEVIRVRHRKDAYRK
jgi:mRNA interferase RelE/StbE